MAKGAILGQTQDFSEEISNIENKLNQYLPKSGGSMTGNIDMGSKKITNLSDPTRGNDAVNYKTLNGWNYSDISEMVFLGRGYIPGTQGPSDYTISTPSSDLAIVIYSLAQSDKSVQSAYLYSRNTNRHTFNIGNSQVYVQRTSPTNLKILYPSDRLFFELYELHSIPDNN